VRAISVEGLSYAVRPHFWKARHPILRGVSFGVEPGELYGFLGPNGAGKTTTIKALLGLLTPEAGVTRLFGVDPREPSVRARIGFMPERAYFPEYLTATELLLAHAALAGLTRAEGRRRAGELLERVGLAAAGALRLGAMSKGMQQRVGLAQALIGDPELVILDEPMSGLDPLGRHDVRELMLALKARGKTVFFSTHIIPDVEAICDRVAILVGGRLRRVERLAALLSASAARVEVLAEGCTAQVLSRLVELGPTPRGGGHLLVAGTPEVANAAIDALRAGGATIVSVSTQRRSLEEVFVAESRATEAAP
jgi:ABC-2 type transport system ATP-binding protein